MLLKSPKSGGASYWSRSSSTLYPLTTSDKLQIDGAVTFSSTLGVTGLVTLSSGLHIVGDVGIGTTSPGFPLEVNSSAANTGVRVANSSTGGAYYNVYSGAANRGIFGYDGAVDALKFNYGGTLGGVNHLVIDSTGRVGIGTATPGDELEVNGGTTISSALAVTGLGTFSSSLTIGSTCNISSGLSVSGALSVTASGQFSTSVEMNGNVNISKADPEMRLTDTGNSEYTRWLKADTNNQMYLYNRIAQPGLIATDLVLLLHNDSSSFPDASTFGNTMTASGTVACDTTTYKFTGSLYTSGAGYISTPDSSAFTITTSDFTIDLWVLPASTSQTGYIIHQPGTNGYSPFMIFQTGQVYQFYGAYGTAAWNISAQPLGNVSTSWTHLAVCRSGTTLRFFQNGSMTTSVACTGSFMDSSGFLCINGYPSGSKFNGRTDEVRISNGVAYYTSSSYTVPTAPYGEGATREISLIDSKDGLSSGEAGIHTFGTSSGTVIFNGSLQQFNINGTTKATLSSGGYLGVNTAAPTSNLHSAGSFARQTTVTTSNTTLDSTSNVLICNAGITVTLPASSSITGREYIIKNISTASVTINVNSTTNTIDGSTSKSVANQYDSVTLIAGNNNFNIV